MTESVGRYTIEVAPVRADAPRGDYTIVLAPAHAATAADRADVSRLHEAIAEYVRGQVLNAQESQQAKVQALAAYERALAHLPASAGPLWRATMLTLIHETHWDLGQFEEATASKEEALKLWREAGDADGEAETLYNRAVDFHHRGALDTAMEYAQAGQSRWVDAQNPRGEAIARALIGRIHDTFGQFQAAIDDYLKALTAIEPLRDYSWQALITHNLGMVYFSLGEYDAARAQYQRAIDLSAEAHESPAHVLHHLGEVYLAMADYSQAAALLERALTLDDDDLGRATTLLHLARLHAATGDAPGALVFAERALEKRRAAQYVLGQAQVHFTIGVINQKIGALQPAEASLTRARDMSRAMHDTRLEAMALTALASIHEQSASSASPRARDEALAAVALIEGLRVAISNPELRTAYFATLHDAYEVAVDASMQLFAKTGDAVYQREAFEMHERGRGRSLLDTFAEIRHDVREGAPKALLDERRAVLHRLSAISEQRLRLSNERDTTRLDALDRTLDGDAARLRLIDDRIAAINPRYATFLNGRPSTAAAVQKSLGPDTQLVEYSLGEQRSYVWIVSLHGITSRELPARRIIASAGQKYVAVHSRRPEDNQRSPSASASDDAERRCASAELSALVLAPIGPLITATRLAIVGDGVLQYVPFSALDLPGGTATSQGDGTAPQALIARYEVVQPPSASVLVALRTARDHGAAPPSAAEKTLALFADPVFGTDDTRYLTADHSACAGSPVKQTSEFKRLLYTGAEKEAVLRVVPPEQEVSAEGFDANLARLEAIGQVRFEFLHLATHGVFDSRRPQQSGLVFSLIDDCGRRRDGFLGVSRVYNLRLAARVVVLSACDTALGRDIKGEGVVGLVNAFLYAGARTVLASLWDVGDISTANLMAQFYENAIRKRMNKAAALRTAQLALRSAAQWSSDYYWGAFIIEGDWE